MATNVEACVLQNCVFRNTAAAGGNARRRGCDSGGHRQYGLRGSHRAEANTRYYYGVVIEDRLVDTRIDGRGEFPHFRTLPDERACPDSKYNPRGLFNLKFSVGCCADQHPEPDRGGQYEDAPAFGTMFRRHGHDLAFHLMNGDFVYEELRDGTMAGLRNNFKLYWERGRNLSHLHRHVPVLFTYDDHEISSEDGPGEVGLKKGAWLGRDTGLSAWYEYAGWANFEGRLRAPLRFGKADVRAGDTVLHDAAADFSSLDEKKVSTVLVLAENRNAGVYRFAEILDRNRLRVEPAFTSDEMCTYSIGTYHFYDWKVGNCHYFALDARGQSNRYTPQRAHDPNRTILGKAQVDWLIEGVRNTRCAVCFYRVAGIVGDLPHEFPCTKDAAQTRRAVSEGRWFHRRGC